jgi:hypothetical protein
MALMTSHYDVLWADTGETPFKIELKDKASHVVALTDEITTPQEASDGDSEDCT